MDIDSRGVKRGACEPGCGCTAYEREVDKSTFSCGYCGCPPMKHKKIENDSHSEESISVLPGVYTLEKNNLVIKENFLQEETDKNSSNHKQILTGDSNLFNRTDFKVEGTGSLESSFIDNSLPTSPSTYEKPFSELSQKLEDISIKKSKIEECIPTDWRPSVKNASSNNESLEADCKNAMIRDVVHDLVKNNLTTADDLDIASKLLVEKYSCMQSDIVPGSGPVLSKMRRCLYNLTYNNKKKAEKKDSEKSASKKDEPLVTDSSDAKQSLINIMLEDNPNKIRVKSLLTLCRKRRINDLQVSPSAAHHMEEYPALRDPDILLWEFGQLVGADVTAIKEKWLNALPKLKLIFKIADCEDDDRTTVKVLLNLGDHFIKAKKKKCPMIEIHNDKTTMNDVKPKADEPPRLIGIGSTDKNKLYLSIYIDGEPIYSNTAINALIFLYALYTVFDVQYPSTSEALFMFVAAILLPNIDIQTGKYRKKISVVNLLERLNAL